MFNLIQSIIISLMGLFAQTGYVSQYALLPSIATIQYRLDIGEITPEQSYRTDVYIAVPECNRIGEEGYIKIENSPWLRYLVFDCAVPNNLDGALNWMLDNNILAEIDYYSARRYIGEVRGGVKIKMFTLSNS